MKNFETLEVGNTYIDSVGAQYKITHHFPTDHEYPYRTESGRGFMSSGQFDRIEPSEYDLIAVVCGDNTPEVQAKKMFLINVEGKILLVDELPQGKKIVVLSVDADEHDVELVKNVLAMTEMTRFYSFK